MATYTERLAMRQAAYSPATDDEDENRPLTYTERLRMRQGGGEQGELNPLARAGLGAARGIASTLEPLALPQDILFAVVGGALDDDTSIGDRLKTVEWGKYAPFGATPARPADGSEILGLMGVTDERTKKWGGLVLDFTADPLIAGAAIRAGGKLSGLEDLVKLGDRVDEMTSIGGQFRAVRNLPGVKGWADKRTEEMLRFARNPDNKIFGRSAGEYAKGFLTSRVTRNLRYGEEAGEAISDARGLADQRASDVRTRSYDLLAEAENGLLGKDAAGWFQKGLGILSGARKADERLRGLPQILRDTISKETYDLSQRRGVLLTEGLESSTLPEIQQLRGLASLIGEPRRTQAASDTEAAIKKVRGIAEQNKFDPNLAERRFRDYSQRIAEVDALHGFHVSGFDIIKKRTIEQAKKFGLTQDDTINLWNDAVAAGMRGNFDEFLNRPVPNYAAGKASPPQSTGSVRGAYSYAADQQVQSFMAEGRYASPWYRSRLERANDPADFWGAARFSAADGEPGMARHYATRGLEEARRKGDSQAESAFTELLDDLGGAQNRASTRAEARPTFKDVLDGDESFSALGLGQFFKGLQEGHMRRSFAMFQDAKGAENWIDSVRTGKVMMSNLLGDDMVDNALSGMPAGEGRMVRDLVKDYRGALELEGRGTILTQRGILNHLTENGVSKRDAEEAYRKLIVQMNPELEPVVAQLRDVATKFAADGQARGAGTAFYGPRNEELDQEFLSLLGEYANPIVSLAESADAAKVRIGRQDFMRDVYRIAEERGLIKDEAFTDRNGAVFKPITDGEQVWGAFHGKRIHPYLQMELERTMKPPALRNIPLAKAYDRIRSMITGGYLASPSVITANIAGGIYTSTLAGIAPGRMMGALASTFMPLYRGESEDLKRLKEFIQVEDASVAGQAMQQYTKRLSMAEAGITKGRLGEAFDNISSVITDQLQAPLGAKWAGLEGFQFVEKWMRTAAFKAERDYWMNDLGRLEKYVPGVNNMPAKDQMLAVEKFAAQKARISVMDYSELPDVVTGLRDSGLLMFPGFSYLITARNLNAAINKPGKIAAFDRVNEAIWSSQMSDEEKLGVYAGMPDWLREDGGVPVRMMIDQAGDKRYSLIPLQGLLPTNTNFGKPFAESLTNLGLYAPFFELATAAATGEGKAVITGRYGKEVFSPDARGTEKAVQSMNFMYQSLAPGFLRKTENMARAAIRRASMPMDPDLANTLYSFQELNDRKAQRRLADEVLSTMVRAPAIITTSGRLANWKKEAASLRIRRDNEIRSLERKMKEALYTGRTDEAERLRAEIQERRQEFNELTQSLSAMRDANSR